MMQTSKLVRFTTVGLALAALAALPMGAQTTTRVPIARKTRPTKAKAVDCWWLPMRNFCAGKVTDEASLKARNAYVNSFWNTASPYSFFDQVKSVYNASSGGTTVAADLADLGGVVVNVYGNDAGICIIASFVAGAGG